MDDAVKARLAREARRIYLRYAVEVVEAFHFCPWAERARREGRTRIVVVTARGADAEPEALAAIQALGEDPEVEVGFVIFPRGERSRRAFERQVATLREQDAARHGGSPHLALAAFHPDAEADLSSPARLIPYIRRSPDPTIQCVRCSVLEALRRPADQGTGYVDLASVNLQALLAAPLHKPLHERVAEANQDTVQRGGLERVEAALRAIREDRDRSYAALGRTSGPA